MTQEEKQLLLMDICGRLPYHPTFVHRNNSEVKGALVQINSSELVISPWGKYYIEECKPYLRPMSSMTEEEEKEISRKLNYEFYVDDESALCAADERHRIRLDLIESYVDWLNKKMFDWRGLIPMGLSLEAPEGMYKTESL